MRIRWLTKALRNLESEVDFLAKDSPQAASSFLKRVEESVENLKDYPAIGRVGRVFGSRELVLVDFPYIIPYRVQKEEIQILRVFHTSRKWPEKF